MAEHKKKYIHLPYPSLILFAHLKIYLISQKLKLGNSIAYDKNYTYPLLLIIASFFMS